MTTRYAAILIAAALLAATACTRVVEVAAPTPTTTVTFEDQATWEAAAILVLSRSAAFDSFTDDGILRAINLVCQTAYDVGDGAAYIMAIATEGGELVTQVGQILGVLNVPPGCADATHQRYIDQAIRYVEDF